MRKMKSRVLAVLMAAGMIFTAQGMTVLAGTTGIGAAKTASQTGGPGEVKQDIGTVTVDDTQETSGETGQNTGSQEKRRRNRTAVWTGSTSGQLQCIFQKSGLERSGSR